MEKKVKRGSVDITIGATAAKSPHKVLSNYPTTNELSDKYGLTLNNDTNNNKNKLTNEMDYKEQHSNNKLNQVEQHELLQKIEEKNKKIEQLCIMLEALEITPGVDPQKIQKLINEGLDEHVDLRDSKIVHLAKKSHRLTMQLNKESTTNHKLTVQLAEAQQMIDTLKLEVQHTKLLANQRNNNSNMNEKIYNRNSNVNDSTTTADDHMTTIHSLQRDLKESNKAIDDLKKKLSQSTEEAKQLSRALTRELGEGITLEQAVDGGWRGRAQQIIMLKAKIKKLEAGQSSMLGGNNSMIGSTTVVTSSGYGTKSVISGHQNMQSTIVDVDRKASEDLSAMSNERRQIVEALTEERISLMEANQNLEKKNSGQKARIHSLEADVKKLKESLQVVIDKSTTDDELVDALKNELDRLKNELKNNHIKGIHNNNSPTNNKYNHSNTSISATYFNDNSYNNTMNNVSTHSHTMNKRPGRNITGQSITSDIQHKHHTHNSMDDSLDFMHSKITEERLQQSEAEKQQMQSELLRLRRLCKTQSEQLDTQDVTIRQLKKKLNPDY